MKTMPFKLMLCLLFVSGGLWGCGDTTEEELTGEESGEQGANNQEPESCEGVRCPGAAAPMWSLEDFQPRSGRFGQSYGLEVFEGKVVLVAMLASWCPYCQQQAELMEGLRDALRDEGLDVEFVAVNAANASDTQENFVELCSFPLLQDTEEDGVWGLHESGKDDFLIYRPDGTLHLYMTRQEYNTSLATEEGYALVRDKLREAGASQ
jgi:thiol-disulfide isomerase/thioredoxin